MRLILEAGRSRLSVIAFQVHEGKFRFFHLALKRFAAPIAGRRERRYQITRPAVVSG